MIPAAAAEEKGKGKKDLNGAMIFVKMEAD